jgi:regulator of RNase E activity RraA
MDKMEITVFVDSDHAHDKVTRRSITGMIIFVGRTPVVYSSKRQGAIETSTYGAEFCAMKNGVEELIALRYMLRCLGVSVEHASILYGDNQGVIQNATIAESLLKKKHVAIAYHKTRESRTIRQENQRRQGLHTQSRRAALTTLQTF